MVMRVRVTAPERRRKMRLRDGRTLAWSEWGPEAGLGVLYCPGAGMSGWLGFGWEEARRLGVRLLAVDRPGLGGSDPDGGKTFASWAVDVAEWRRWLGLEGLRAVGFSQGAAFALALGATGLAERVAVVSGQDELAEPRVRAMLPAGVAAMVEEAEGDPAGLERKFAAVATAEKMLELILAFSGEGDRRMYEEPEMRAGLERALAEGFGQGAHGYARDLANAMGRWGFRVEGIGAPVALWYGEEDRSPVHSPDYGETLAGRLRRGMRRVVRGEGGAVLWTRAGEILEELRG